MKRAFDLVAGALLVASGCHSGCSSPLAIKLESRGPVFYVDRRIGVGEREFGMLKFRTMVAEPRRSKRGSSRRTRPRARCSRSATTPA